MWKCGECPEAFPLVTQEPETHLTPVGRRNLNAELVKVNAEIDEAARLLTTWHTTDRDLAQEYKDLHAKRAAIRMALTEEKDPFAETEGAPAYPLPMTEEEEREIAEDEWRHSRGD